jgi:hypothetical protein
MARWRCLELPGTTVRSDQRLAAVRVWSGVMIPEGFRWWQSYQEMQEVEEIKVAKFPSSRCSGCPGIPRRSCNIPRFYQILREIFCFYFTWVDWKSTGI